MREASLDPETVRRIVTAQFPGIRGGRVTYLGEGYDSTAFEIDGEWVFRFPKREDVEAQLGVEMRMLPLLSERSPIPLPIFRFHGKPSALFARHFGGYRKLRGVPAIGVTPSSIPMDRWVPLLARFLSSLHAFAVDEAVRLGVPTWDVASVLEELRLESLENLEQVKHAVADQPLELWHAQLARGGGAFEGPRLVLVHSDLAAEHVLYDPATLELTGIIDWSDVAIADPSFDLAALFHWGGALLANRVLSMYEGPLDEATIRRARFLAACRGVGDIGFGLETGRREYIDGGIRAMNLSIERRT